jgi:hypothetical protein
VGRSIKSVPNGQAEPHADGSLVHVIQVLVHEPIGALGYHWGPQTYRHAKMAEDAFVRLVELHAGLVDIQPLSGNVRLVPAEIATEAYECGSTMVSNVVRTMRHFALNIASRVGRRPDEGRVLDELRSAAAMIGLDLRLRSSGYEALAEIVRVRDAIEHPKPENLHQGDDARWDQVPLAWILSDRSRKAYADYDAWLGPIVNDWNAWIAAQPKHPQTLTVQRGMGSAYPMKKPPAFEDRASS